MNAERIIAAAQKMAADFAAEQDARSPDLPSTKYPFLVGVLQTQVRSLCAEINNLGAPDCPSGSHEILYIGACAQYAVYFDYEPAEQETDDEPGCDASVSIIGIYAGCHEVAGEISEELIESIEAKCLKSITGQISGFKEDAAIDRYESRRDELAGEYA